jgi:hypothetical protein
MTGTLNWHPVGPLRRAFSADFGDEDPGPARREIRAEDGHRLCKMGFGGDKKRTHAGQTQG